MAALTGDIYSMTRQSKGYGNALINPLRGLRVPEPEKDETRDGTDLIQTPDIDTGAQLPGNSGDNALDAQSIKDNKQGYYHAEDSQEVENAIDTILSRFRLWRGDDFQFSESDAAAIRMLAMSSEDPMDAVSRFADASGLASWFPNLTVKDAYDHLDEISQYYTGTDYSAKDVSMWQKIKNGFEWVDIMADQMAWKNLYLSGDTENADKLKQQIQERIEKLGDKRSAIPTSWLDEQETNLLENLGYIAVPMMKGAEASMLVMMAGTPMIAGVTAANPIAGATTAASLGVFSATAGTIRSAIEIKDYAEGSMFWDLMNNYDKQNVLAADWLSAGVGFITAALETFMDGVFSRGLGKITSSVAGKSTSVIGANMLADLTSKGTGNRIVYAALDWVTGGLDEAFLNELPEFLVEEFADAAYRWSIGIPSDISVNELVSGGAESAWNGFLMAMVYGTIDIPLSMRGNKKIALDLRRIANRNNNSWSDFIGTLKDYGLDKPPENSNITTADYDEALHKIYDASIKQRDEFLSKEFKDTVWESIPTAQEELFTTMDSMGTEQADTLPDGSIYRTEDGSLSSFEVKRNDGTSYVYFGDATTGALYGYVGIASDGTTQTIRDVRVRLGYEGIRSEMVTDSLAMTRSTETEVEWNPTTKGLVAVKENLIKSNPRGEQYGLSYELTGNKRDIDIKAMAQEIRSYNPNLTDQQAIVIARLNNIADDKGIISSTNNGKLYENIANLPKEYLKKYNVKREDINAATDYAKALIYVGQNSNSSSFTHELFHVVSYLRPEESKQLSNAIRHTLADEDRRSNLETFIDGHREIWQKAGDNSSTSQIMDRLSEIAENASKWRVGIEEDLARLWEAYQGSSTSIRNNMPKELRNLFEKLSRYIRQVYTTLKDNVALDSEIAKAYDQLMGIEESNKEQASKNDTTSASLRNVESESETKEADEAAIMLFQANRPSNFEEQLESLSEKDIGKKNKTIRFSPTTPFIFKALGLKDLPVEMYIDKLARGLFLSDANKHGHSNSITKDIVSALARQLADPLLVFESATANDSFVAIYDINDLKGNPIVVAIKGTRKGHAIEINIISAIYGKDNTGVFEKWFEEGLLRYVDDKKIRAQLLRLQLPSVATLTFDSRVLTKSQLVNNKNQESPIKTQLSIANEAVEELNLRFQKAPEGASITSADGNTAIQKRNGTLVLSRSVKASRLKDIEAIGGMPMPSLAITKPELQDSLNCYGDITLIGDKGLAEKVIASGAVYDNDMVSPTIPRKRYKIDKPGINTLIRELNDMVPDEIRQTGTGVLQTLDNLREEDYFSANDLAWKFRNKIALTIAYARENGIALPDYLVSQETRKYPEYLENKIQEYFDIKDKPVDISGLDNEIGTVIDNAKLSQWQSSIASNEDVQAWFEKKIAPYYEGPYAIVDGEYLPYTAENLFKSMQSETLLGINDPAFREFGIWGIDGASIRNLRSREEITEKESLLRQRTEYFDPQKILSDIRNSSGLNFNLDSAADAMFSYLLEANTADSELMLRLAREHIDKNANRELAEGLVDLAETLRNKPRSFFEAKPQSVMQLSDFKAAIVPDSISQEQRAILLKNGLELVEYAPDERQLAYNSYIESSTNILFQKNNNEDGIIESQLMDLYDSISNEEEARAIEEALSAYTPDDPAFNKELYDYELPEDFNPEIYYGDEVQDAIDYEAMLAEESTRIDEEMLDSNRLEDEIGSADDSYNVEDNGPRDLRTAVVDANNTYLEFSEFAQKNAPQIVYEGTDAQKDEQFRRAINDPMNLRLYVGIIGGAIYHDTPLLNAQYVQEMNKTYHRLENVKYIDPYTDQEYREGLKERTLKQVQNNDVRKAAKYAIDWKDYPKTTNLEAKVRKEMQENARFYRNILAKLIGDKDMLPTTLVEYGLKLDIPNRDALDLMSVEELSEIAARASQAEVVAKIQNGTLKFRGDLDEKNAKALKEAINQQLKTIDENAKSIEELEAANKNLTEGLDKANKALSLRDEAIESAASLLDSLKRTLLGDTDNGLKTQAAEMYSKLYARYQNLMEEKEYQKANTAKGSRDKGRYYGEKLGTKKYMSDMRAMYPELFISKNDGRDLVWNSENSRDKDNAEIRQNLDEEKARVLSEMKSLRVNMLNSTVRQILLNSKNFNKALDSISDTINGKVASKQEIDSYKKQIQELKDKNNEEVKKLQSAIDELKDKSQEDLENTILEERWKAAKRLNDTKNSYEAKLEQQKSYDSYMKAKAIQELKDENEAKLDDTITWERWKAAKRLNVLRETRNEYKKRLDSLGKELDRTKSRIDALKDKNAENIKKIRENIKEQRKKAKELQRIRDEKQKIANFIMRPINLSVVDYDTSAEAIAAIQALIDPQFRRDWVYDIKLDPQQDTGYATMTIEEAKQYFNSLDDATRIDLMTYLSPELIDRLTEQRKPLNDWTVKELMDLAEQVDALRERGKMVLSAKKEAERMRNNAIKKSIINAINAREGKRGAHKASNSLPGSIDRMSERRSIYYRFHSAMYSTRRIQELAQLLDGGYGIKGAAYKLLVDDKRFHEGREQRAIKKRRSQVEQYLTESNINQMAANVIVDLGDGLQQRFTIDQLAYVYLSQFDEQNKAAVSYGALLSEDEKGTKIDREINPTTGLDMNVFLVDSDKLIADDQTLQETGDSRYKKLLAAATKELKDRGLMDLVNAIKDDFNNADNKRRLNRACIEAYNRPLDARDYYLAIHRIDSNSNALNDNEPAKVFDAGTNSIMQNPDRGFTISRVDISPRYQGNVDMSLLNVWSSSVEAQEHLIENAAYVKQLHSVFYFDQSRELARTIDVGYGHALRNEITNYIDLIADPNRRPPAEGYERTFRWLRGKTGPAYLGWKLSGMILQTITSPMPALSEVGPARLIGAYLELARHPKQMIDMINSKSIFMETRTMNPIIAESIQRTNQWDANKYQKTMNWIEEKGQIGLELVDRYAVAGTWLARYNQALEENLKQGMDTQLAEGAAIKTADDFVHRTQPEGNPTELASLFRSKNEILRIFLQFQTSLNVIYNNMTADSVGFVRNGKYKTLVGTYIGYALAGVILGLVQEGFDDDDDNKDRILKLLYWSLTQGVSSIPVLGSEIENLAHKLLTGDGYFMSQNIFPGISKLEQAITAGAKGNWARAIGKAAEGAGLYLGIPTSAIKQAISAAQGDWGALIGR